MSVYFYAEVVVRVIFYFFGIRSRKTVKSVKIMLDVIGSDVIARRKEAKQANIVEKMKIKS